MVGSLISKLDHQHPAFSGVHSFFVVCLFIFVRDRPGTSTELLPQPWSYNFWSLQSFKTPFSFPMGCQRKGLLFMFKPVSQCEELRCQPWGCENIQRKRVFGVRIRAPWMGSLAAGRHPPNSLALSSGLKSLNFLVLVLRRQTFTFLFYLVLSIEPRAFHREYSSQVSYVPTYLADVYYIQLHSTCFKQNKKARDFLPMTSASLPPTQPSTHHCSLIRHSMGLGWHDLFQVNPHLSLVTTTSFLYTAHQLFNNLFF